MNKIVKVLPFLLLMGCNNIFARPQEKIWFEPNNSRKTTSNTSNRSYKNFFTENDNYKNNNQYNEKMEQKHIIQSEQLDANNGDIYMNNVDKNYDYGNTNKGIKTDENLTRYVNSSFSASQPSVLAVREEISTGGDQRKNNIFIQQKHNFQENSNIENKKYRIQCGNFSKEMSARAVASAIMDGGIKDVKIIHNDDRYRVVVGSFSEREEGIETFNKLKELGFEGIFWVFI